MDTPNLFFLLMGLISFIAFAWKARSSTDSKGDKLAIALLFAAAIVCFSLALSYESSRDCRDYTNVHVYDGGC